MEKTEERPMATANEDWRKVTDALPGDQTEVLVLTDTDRVTRGRYFDFAKSWRIIDSFTEDVVMWQPIQSATGINGTTR